MLNMKLDDDELAEVTGGRMARTSDKDMTGINSKKCSTCGGTGTIDKGRHPVPCTVCGGTGKISLIH